MYYMIEGEWSGPQSPAGNWTRFQHREFTQSKKRAEAINELGSIRYSDGTYLYLTVTEGKGPAKKRPAIDGYGKLINECLRYGVSSVDELYKRKAEAKQPA